MFLRGFMLRTHRYVTYVTYSTYRTVKDGCGGADTYVSKKRTGTVRSVPGTYPRTFVQPQDRKWLGPSGAEEKYRYLKPKSRNLSDWLLLF